MKGSAFLPIFLAALAPLLVFGIIISGAATGIVAWRPVILWTDQFGNRTLYRSDSAVTSAAMIPSGFIASGYLNEGPNGGSLFVKKYDLRNAVQWNHIVANETIYSQPAVSVGPNGVYVLAESSSGNATLLNYDLNGNLFWSRQFMASTSDAISATVSEVFVVGTMTVKAANQTYPSETMFLREFDSVGNTNWTSTFSSASNFVRGAYASSEGIYVIGDDFFVKYGQGGSKLWMHSDGGMGISGDSSGIYIAGNMQLVSGSIRKYDFNGNLIWTQELGGPETLTLGPLLPVFSSSSGIYLAVNSVRGYLDIFKYDSDGHQIWSFQYPGITRYWLSSDTIVVSPDGVYVGGSAGPPGASYGSLEEITQSSSLVFFGLNPPYSFIALSTLIATGVLACLVLIKFKRKATRTGSRHDAPPVSRLPVKD